MKKLLFLLLIVLMAFDVDAQLIFNPKTSGNGLVGLSASDEFSSMLAKKRKKRKSSSRKRGKSKGRGKSSGAGLNIGGGLTYGLPMGDFGDAVNGGIGLNIEGDYFIMPQLSAGISTGYLSFKYKTVAGSSGSFNIIPFQLRGNFYLMEDAIRPYIGLGLGLFFDNSHFEMSIPTFFMNPVTNQMDTVMIKSTFDDKTTDFAISPTVGVLFSVSDQISVNVSACYNMFSLKDAEKKTYNYSFLGLNFGVVYSL